MESGQTPELKIIAWELTRRCYLRCTHCRGAARDLEYSGELDTAECLKLVDVIASKGSPLIILTGGEPMTRPDLYEIAARCRDRGLRTALSPCGWLLDDVSCRKLIESGISKISISLDGPDAASHDEFRGVPGAFEKTLKGLDAARRAGIGFQINTTVTVHNASRLDDVYQLAVRLGADLFNPFLLVPTGRGAGLAGKSVTAGEYEHILEWIVRKNLEGPIPVRPTCAPHYERVRRQTARAGGHGNGTPALEGETVRRGEGATPLAPSPSHPLAPSSTAGSKHHGGALGGCLGGLHFAFISHTGKIQICGFLDVPCGDLRENGLDIWKIWESSPFLKQIRDLSAYRGKCGACEYLPVCRGCRARARAVGGDPLGPEPYCSYVPKRMRKQDGASRARVLDVIQQDLPLSPSPFSGWARQSGLAETELLDRIRSLKADGTVRRFGGVFDSRAMGYATTLVGAVVPEERLEQALEFLAGLPGATHVYVRDHRINVWFTHADKNPATVHDVLRRLVESRLASFAHEMPARRFFKLDARFGAATCPSGGSKGAVEDQGACRAASGAELRRPSDSALTALEEAVVREFQGDLELRADLYGHVAARLGIDTGEVLSCLSGLKARGALKQIRAVVRHQKLGFSNNFMIAMRVPPERIELAGTTLAALPFVTHCYERSVPADFPYPLFAMAHARSPEEEAERIAAIVEAVTPEGHEVLRSVREAAKRSMTFVERAW